jgi:hypothetical protein
MHALYVSDSVKSVFSKNDARRQTSVPDWSGSNLNIDTIMPMYVAFRRDANNLPTPFLLVQAVSDLCEGNSANVTPPSKATTCTFILS